MAVAHVLMGPARRCLYRAASLGGNVRARFLFEAGAPAELCSQREVFLAEGE